MTPKLRTLGFCGVDDSVHPNLLGLLANAYPLVEFGVLFRPDKEGQARYASTAWVEQLSRVSKLSNGGMKLAAHLCGTRVNEVLKGDDQFIKTCAEWGFQRVQINATALNGADTSVLAESVPTFLEVIQDHPELEFIIQRNQETQPLWQGLLDASSDDSLPANLSMLVDESKGTGQYSGSSWPSPPKNYDIGYAGGIGPHNIRQVLHEVAIAGQGRDVWIDMESSLRSTIIVQKDDSSETKDIFDLGKCYQVIHAVCAAGLCSHPSYLPKASSS